MRILIISAFYPPHVVGGWEQLVQDVNARLRARGAFLQEPAHPHGGDVVAVRDKSRQLAIVLEAVGLAERDVPDYIEADHNKMTATFVRTPGLADVPYPVMMEPHLVIEFYAQN